MILMSSIVYSRVALKLHHMVAETLFLVFVSATLKKEKNPQIPKKMGVFLVW
tara:strand:- start:397 stop:552 length:156 start_codon:yes stop_codon:yes gene_type:complete